MIPRVPSKPGRGSFVELSPIWAGKHCTTIDHREVISESNQTASCISRTGGSTWNEGKVIRRKCSNCTWLGTATTQLDFRVCDHLVSFRCSCYVESIKSNKIC